MEEQARANRTTRTEIGHEVQADTFVLMETARIKARQERLEREMKRRLQAEAAGGLQHFARAVGPIVSYGFTELSMQDYEAIYRQWTAGLVTLEEVEREPGRDVREMLELQRVAVEGGFESA